MAMTTILIGHALYRSCSPAAIASIFCAMLLNLYVHGLHANVAYKTEAGQRNCRHNRPNNSNSMPFNGYCKKVTEIVKTTTNKIYSLKEGANDKKPVIKHEDA